MTKFDVKHIKFVGDADETRKFRFRILLDDVVYNSVFEDGYIQCIEIAKKPFEQLDEDIILEISEIVQFWFVMNENKAWWILQGEDDLDFGIRQMTTKAYSYALLYLVEEIEGLKTILKNKNILEKQRESFEERIKELEYDFNAICYIHLDYI